MIQNGERLLDSGNLYLTGRNGGHVPVRALRREVDRSGSTETVIGKIGPSGSGYRLVCSSDGTHLRITLKQRCGSGWWKRGCGGCGRGR
jgi:hypothetical protein